jgi:hypothetical protein
MRSAVQGAVFIAQALRSTFGKVLRKAPPDETRRGGLPIVSPDSGMLFGKRPLHLPSCKPLEEEEGQAIATDEFRRRYAGAEFFERTHAVQQQGLARAPGCRF